MGHGSPDIHHVTTANLPHNKFPKEVIMPDFQSSQTIHDLMCHAWDSVTSLAATARIMPYYLDSLCPSPQKPPRFLRGKDIPAESFPMRAYWKAPDHWYYQARLPQGIFEYGAVGNRFWGTSAGEITSGVRPKLVDLQTMTYSIVTGDPLLTPQQNAHYHLWLNPQMWARDTYFVVLDYSAVVRDHWCYHLLARLREPGAVLPPDTRIPVALADDYRDFTGDFYQLWVDMTTGFLWRLTGEGFNGREWDIIIDELVINEAHRIPHDAFSAPRGIL